MIIRTFTLFTALSAFSFCSAQQEPIYHPHWNYYFSFGAGPSMLSNFDSEIYQDGHSNVQFGFLIERSISQRFSILSGVELERMQYAFDGIISETDQAKTRVSTAPAGIKYTGIVRNNLAIPVQLRFYFKPNLDPDEPSVYVQGGIRYTLNGSSDFVFREGGESQSNDISSQTNNRTLSGEFMLGFRGDFFERLDLLNASSFGVIYQFTPMFEESAQPDIHPLHLTWRFLF